jgi:hypothetical protein
MVDLKPDKKDDEWISNPLLTSPEITHTQTPNANFIKQCGIDMIVSTQFI